MRRLGVLGGTFDPVHLGHLRSALEVAAAFDLDRVLLVVSARPPHKDARSAASAADRLAMVRLAVAGEPRLEASAIEVDRPGPSWTVDTLREVAGSFPGAELFLILGIDAWMEIDTWSRPAEIPALANVIVTSRPGHAGVDEAPRPPFAALADARYDPAIGFFVHTSGHVIHGHRLRGLEVSATEVRRLAAHGLPFEHLTGASVARYILDHHLYGAGLDDALPGPHGEETP